MQVTNFISPALLIMTLGILVIVTTTNQQARASDASDAGMQAAREDFRNRDGFHGSCEYHGYDVTQNPGFCLSFKSAYAFQWAILVAGR